MEPCDRINGRGLPRSEWVLRGNLIGTMARPGAYWIDNSGNAGPDGSPVPPVHRMVAAQQAATGGDHFWSIRFGAGSCDAGNTCGYVSVPGVCPVGYGLGWDRRPCPAHLWQWTW